jgi:rhamnosyltransferase subunit B
MIMPQEVVGRRRARIVLATTGTFGDFYPYVALAAALQTRGHSCVIATSGHFRAIIERAGVDFALMRPELTSDPAFQNKLFQPARVARTWFHEIQMPMIEDAYRDLHAIAQNADLLVSSNLASYAASLVAEVAELPWITTKFSPGECLSAYDFPYTHRWRWAVRLVRRSPTLSRWVVSYVRRLHRRLNLAPLETLRHKLGLPPSDHDEYWGPVGPRVELRLFSPLLGKPQPDWPSYARQTGFLFIEEVQPASPLAPELERFLHSGAPPIVFTLGSLQYIEKNRQFLKTSFEALQDLGCRAILLTGNQENRSALPAALPSSLFTIDQAPHGALFPRAKAIVHHCGVGTLAQALRSGRPQLGVPFVFDQPDNSTRLTMLGVGLAVHSDYYTPARAARALSRLISEPSFEARAATVAHAVSSEHGLEAACAAIESALQGSRHGSFPAPPFGVQT